MLRHEKCEYRFSQIKPGSLDMVCADAPFNVSQLAKGEKEISGFDDHIPFKRELAPWDFDYSPREFIELAAVATRPGGWLINKSGDVNFGMIREFGERSPDTLKHYIEFFFSVGVLPLITPMNSSGLKMPDLIMKKLQDIPKLWKYHCTIVWHKTNPVPRVRVSTPLSSVEYLQVLKRLDPKGRTVKSVAFNFLNQTEDMHNFIQVAEGPICLGNDRLYWHSINGEIVPCHRRGCYLCNNSYERLSHPTQTPLHVWDWIFRRFTVPGMKVYDPYAGLGTTIMSNKRSNFGLDIFGSEQSEEYVRVHKMWKAGEWTLPRLPDTVQQHEMF